jgi:hypothetical protein
LFFMKLPGRQYGYAPCTRLSRSNVDSPKITITVIFEDNAACVAQVGAGFIKTDRVKHISPHLYGYTQDLVETKQIEVKKIESAHNIADIMTKVLPAYTHRRLVQEAGMRLLHEIV